MTRARILQEVRQMRFEELYERTTAAGPHDGGGGPRCWA